MNKLVFLLVFIITFIACDLIPREKLLMARQDARSLFATTHETEINALIVQVNTTLLDITVDRVSVQAPPSLALEMILRGFDASYAMNYDVCAQTLTFFVNESPKLTLCEIGNYIQYCAYYNYMGKCENRVHGVYRFSSRAEFEDNYALSKFYTMHPETECAK